MTPQPKAVTIFGREPAVILGFAEALLAAFVVFPLGARLGLDAGFVVVAMAVISAGIGVYSAIATRDTRLGVFLGLIKAILGLAAYFKFQLSAEETAMVVTLAAAAIGMFQRTQTSPVADPVDPSPQQVTASPVTYTVNSDAPAAGAVQAVVNDALRRNVGDPA